MAVIVAHQGGWDEALFVALPMAVFAVLMLRAKRRAEAEADAEGRVSAERQHDDPARPEPGDR